jgi:JmjC domain
LPRGVEGRCIVYANPTSETVVPHFDANANFVVQLRGVKRWRLAPNDWVENPTDRYAINMKAPPPTLAAYARSPAPTAMPADAQVVDLQPGSVLFVPRGMWHATESLQEALSLNFTFSQPCWADLVTAEIRRRLIRHPRWRALADGVHAADFDARATASARLDELLDRLDDDIGSIDAGEVVEATYYAGCYQLVPGLAIRTTDTEVIVSTPDGNETTVEVDDDYCEVLPWIATRREPFSRRELGAQFPALANRAIVDVLVDAGILEMR